MRTLSSDGVNPAPTCDYLLIWIFTLFFRVCFVAAVWSKYFALSLLILFLLQYVEFGTKLLRFNLFCLFLLYAFV